MKTKKGAAVLSVLLYAQGLLGIAAVAAALMKAPAHLAFVTPDSGKAMFVQHIPAG